MEKLFVGDMVFIPFPFAEADNEKNRWAFVLCDKGDNVLVVYCTTCPEWRGSVRLGQVGDSRVSNLVPYRYEEVAKERIITKKGVVKLHAPCPGVGDLILNAFRREILSGRFGSHTADVVEALKNFRLRGEKQAAKAMKKSLKK